MTPTTLILPRAVAEQLLAHARAEAPRECCGLLVGQGLRVTRAVPTANIAAEPTRRFEIDPQRQFDLLRAVRGTAEEVIGHYHSHPGAAPEPSAHDLAMAHDPEAVWVIVSPDRPAETMAAYRRADPARGFTRLALEIV
ncbi:MAG: M67 family metallopeptidase [Rhodospirillaceae bacterium]|nr:M67 family metallopeptidase [Rhodospirillaceae bacterium]